MTESRRTIFRTTAFERYVRGRDRVVLVRYIAPRAFAYVWALLAVLLSAALLVAVAPMPEYAVGTAVILGRDGNDEAVAVAVLVPARYAPRLQVGQTASLRTERGWVQTTTIQSMTNEVVSPSVAQRRFGPSAGLGAVAREPGIIVEVRIEGDAIDTGEATADGSPDEVADDPLLARVQVGTRPAWTLLAPSPQSGEE